MYSLPKKIERHILIVETPEGRSPGRGDIENSVFDMDRSSRWSMLTLEHPGTISEDLSKIIMHKGEWKRGHEYIYGPANDWEKITENTAMINAMREAIKVLCVENAKIRAATPGVLDHYAKDRSQSKDSKVRVK